MPETSEIDALLRQCRELMEKADSLDTQAELYRLHDVIARAQACGASNLLGSAQAALAVAKAPVVNLNIIRETRNWIDLQLLNRNPGLVSYIRSWLGDSPVYAMLIGVCLACGLAVVLFLLIVIPWVVFANLGWIGKPLRLNDIVTVSLGSVIGASLSILSRSNDFANLYVFDPFLILVNCLVKTIIACGFTITAYCVLLSQVVQVSVIAGFFSDEAVVGFGTAKHAGLMWTMGFVVGFSERLATDLIARAEGLLGANDRPK